MICKAKGTDKFYGSGKGSVQDCKFPFIQHGIRYKGCAPSVEKGKGRLCATEVDKEGNLKKWARCNKYCGKDQGGNLITVSASIRRRRLIKKSGFLGGGLLKCDRNLSNFCSK